MNLTMVIINIIKLTIFILDILVISFIFILAIIGFAIKYLCINEFSHINFISG